MHGVADHEAAERLVYDTAVDGLGGQGEGIKKVQNGVLAVTFYYPLCVDKAIEIGDRILREPGFKPEKEYMMESAIVTPENAAEMYEKYTADYY